VVSLSISQRDYVEYDRNLEQIKIVEQCWRKQDSDRIGFCKGRVVKLERSNTLFFTPLESISRDILPHLKSTVSSINATHETLKKNLVNRPDDCSLLIKERYNKFLKIFENWNENAPTELPSIILLPQDVRLLDLPFPTETPSEAADRRALERYVEYLEKYPQLKRPGEWNDHTKGTYQIIYDLETIKQVREELKQKLYNKAIGQGLSPSTALERALEWSRPGVVFEDAFWVVLRDVVISPQNYRHTYNRLVWKSSLEGNGGAAALPILIDDQGKAKMVVLLAYRHATNSWEWEMPRGASKPNETPEATAKREVLEEAGSETNQLKYVGELTPDSGVTTSIVPVYWGKVTKEGKAKPDKTEAIKKQHAFTFQELKEAFRQGYWEAEIEGKTVKVPMRDAGLARVLFALPDDPDLNL